MRLSSGWRVLAAGLVLVLLALHLLVATSCLWSNVLILASGAAFALAGIWRLACYTWPAKFEAGLGRVAAWLGLGIGQLVSVLLGLILSVAARSAAGDGPLAHSPLATPLWAAGIVLVIIGLRRKQDSATRERWPAWEVILVVILAIAALLLRSWHAASLPHVLSGDEGSVGLTAWEFRTGHRNNLLSLGWFSFPAFYFWLVSLSQAVLGSTVEAIRWVSALGGALTVVALYASARSLFGRPTALWSALWLAAFHHHLFFSRVAYNNIWDGFFFIAAAGCIWEGRATGGRAAYLWAGLAMGLGQYFYTTSHLALLILGIWLILLHGSRRTSEASQGRGGWADVACLGLVAASVAMPLTLLYASHPASLVFTSEQVTIFAPGWSEVARALGLSPLGLVLEQIWVTALGFVVAEVQGVYYAPGVPLLFSVSAGMFVLGFLLCLTRVRDPRYSLPLLTLLGTLIVGGLSIQAPNGQRMLLMPPVLALMATLPLNELLLRLKNRWPRSTPIVFLGGTALIAVMMAQNLGHFFGEYLPTEEYGSLNGEVAQEMASFLAEMEHPVSVYFVGGERMQFDSFPSLFYLFPDARGQDLQAPYVLSPSEEGTTGRRAFIVLPEQAAALDVIEAHYGPGQVVQRYNRQGQLLFTAYLPGATGP